MLELASERVFVPLTVGGGIRSHTDDTGKARQRRTVIHLQENGTEYFPTVDENDAMITILGITRSWSPSFAWSAEQGKVFFPCPRSRLKIWSCEPGSTVPTRVSPLILYSVTQGCRSGNTCLRANVKLFAFVGQPCVCPLSTAAIREIRTHLVGVSVRPRFSLRAQCVVQIGHGAGIKCRNVIVGPRCHGRTLLCRPQTYTALEVASRYFRAGADKVSLGSDAVYASKVRLR